MMANQNNVQLTLDREVIYQIKVPGELDQSWHDWVDEMKVFVELDSEGFLVSTMISKLDQAALQGLLRRLYTHGLPLISVICLEVN